VVQQVQAGQSPGQQSADITNAQLAAAGEDEGGTGTGSGTGSGPLLDGTGQSSTSTGPRTLSPLGQRVTDAVNNVTNTVKGALGLNKPKATTGSPSTADSTPAGG
jgi:hypothetical protein